MTFDDIFTIVHRLEGGRVHDPRDPGGLTLGGVTQATYDDYRDRHSLPRQSVDLITPEEIRGLYGLYWLAIRGEALLALHPHVALIVFDAAINQGQGYAAKLLQWALGLSQDGIIGPATLNALHAGYDYGQLTRELLWGRMSRYVATVRYWRAKKHPDPAYALGGWFNRLTDLYARIDPNLNREAP